MELVQPDLEDVFVQIMHRDTAGILPAEQAAA
jgi:hypothetical protein